MLVPESQAEATSAAHHMRFIVSLVIKTTTFLGSFPTRLPGRVGIRGVFDRTRLNGAFNATPRKINMEHNHGGLEDHFPF